MAQMNPNDTQTAAIFNLDVQPKFDVRFIATPCLNRGGG
jgi:hypothetical protein